MLGSLDGFFGYADLTDDTSGGGFGGDRVPIVVTYNANTRLYDCVYTPRKSGVYSLSVFLSNETLTNVDGAIGDFEDAEHIFGSPFVVTTATSVTSPMQSDVYGGNGNCELNTDPTKTFDKSNADMTGWGNWGSSTEECNGMNHGVTNEIQVSECFSE